MFIQQYYLMKKFFILSLFWLLSYNTYSQKIIQEKVLSPAGKSLNLISVFGIKSAFQGVGPGTEYDLTPALDFIDVKDGGFIIRNNFKFTKYSDDLVEEWEVEIKKAFGLQALPNSFTKGNKNAMYYVQVSNSPGFNDIHVTRFDAKGQYIQTQFPVARKYLGITGSFVNRFGLNLILYNFDKKEKKITYTLITLSAADLSIKEKNLLLEHDDYENEKGGNFKLPLYIWGQIDAKEDQIVLIKCYLKEKEDSKAKELIIKTVELSADGSSVSIPKQFTFVPTTDKETRYIAPSVRLDTLNNEFYVYGMMMIEDRLRVNGFYVHKFDYKTGTSIYRREVPFSLFNQLIPEKDRREAVHASFRDVFPVTSFIHATSYLDMPNQGLRLLLYNDSKGLLKDQLKLTGIRLNKNGDAEMIDEYIYKNNIITFYNFYLSPEKRTVYWQDNNPNYKLAPLDYINSLSGKIDPDYTLFSIFYKKDYNLVVSIREKDGEIKAVKLEK